MNDPIKDIKCCLNKYGDSRDYITISQQTAEKLLISTGFKCIKEVQPEYNRRYNENIIIKIV